MSAPQGDFLLPFQLDNVGLRGRLVRLTGVADRVMSAHGYPEPVAELLSQSLALAAVTGGGLKYDGVFTFQTKSDGPITLMVADMTSDGEMRGYASFSEEGIDQAQAAEAAGSPVPRLLGGGYLAFTVDQGPDTERYQGIVELSGATLADCALRYFRQSEQIEAAIRVAAARESNGAGTHWRAAAIMLQRLPPDLRSQSPLEALERADAEDDWRRAALLMSSVRDDELLDPDLPPETLLLRLFPEDQVRVYESRPLLHRCRCSRERVERALIAIPREELKELEVDGTLEVVCQFCNTAYAFTDRDIDHLKQA